MNVLIYVDYPNLVTEARHIQAVTEGKALDVEDAQNQKVFSPWSCEFPALLEVVRAGDVAIRAFLVSSDPFYSRKYAEAAGFDLAVFPRNFREKEKRVDTTFALEALSDAYENADPRFDRFVLVTGDLDQEPTLRKLRELGYHTTVAFWRHASKMLREGALEFLPLNEHWEALSYREGR